MAGFSLLLFLYAFFNDIYVSIFPNERLIKVKNM